MIFSDNLLQGFILKVIKILPIENTINDIFYLFLQIFIGF
jgi:hypothetical protein